MMKEEFKEDLQNAILERPYQFTVGEKHYNIYPFSLGKKILVSSLIEKLDIKTNLLKLNPYAEILRVCKTYSELCVKIVVLCTFQTRDDIFNIERVKTRENEFIDALSDEEIATLLTIILTEKDYEYYRTNLGLDEDAKRMEKVRKVKDSKGTFVFGGKSMYGTLIDTACEKYGWTYEYTVWGISYLSLQLMIGDSVKTEYLSEEEQKKAHIYPKEEVINADDPKNLQFILSQKWD